MSTAENRQADLFTENDPASFCFISPITGEQVEIGNNQALKDAKSIRRTELIKSVVSGLKTLESQPKLCFTSPITGETIEIDANQDSKGAIILHCADVIKSLLGRVEKLEALIKDEMVEKGILEENVALKKKIEN